MNILAAASLLATLALVIGGIILGGSPEAFVNFPSILIVVGGTIGAIGLATPKKELLKVPSVLKSVFEKEERFDVTVSMNMMVNMAKKSRSEGLLALEEEIEKIDDEFIKKSAQLVIDGTPPELVKSIMEAEIDLLERRFDTSKRIFDLMGELAPAFGMLGTLIGLIQMLRNLDTPEALGPGMAVALITTFYGTFIANVFAVPVARKLAARKQDTVTNMEIAVEGILSIQAGENPRLIEEKLKVFLSPEERLKLTKKMEHSRENAGKSYNTSEETVMS